MHRFHVNKTFQVVAWEVAPRLLLCNLGAILVLMSITTNYKRDDTGERLATFQITVRLSAAQLTCALANDSGACYWIEGETERPEVTEAALRQAVQQIFDDGMEIAHYRVSDNGMPDSVYEGIKAAIVAQVFDGREHIAGRGPNA